ncbi:Nn.00g000670.m01.CDS01 [Neocucurbitaria sp. VM-36]
MAATYEEIISERVFVQVTYTMIVLASIFVLARVGIQVWKRKAMELQDYLIYVAFTFFLTMSICYLIIIPKSLVGCVLSYLTSCPDFGAMISRGECSGPRSVRGQLASLYTSYAVDILSDFMIMFLPIRLVWNLQMARGQKIAVIALFASGFVCITFATLRVVQIGTKTGNTTSPSPSWLALWTIIETSIAIGIGCCPAFAVLYRTSRTPHVSYDTHGYIRHNQSRSEGDRSRVGAIKLNTMTVGTARSKVSRNDAYYDDTASSQEELAADSKDIRVTTTLQQDNRELSISNSTL